MSDSSSRRKIYLSWKIPDEGIAKGVSRALEADGFKVVSAQHGRSLIAPIETEIITEMMSGSVLFVGILNRNHWVRDQEDEYKFASILGIPILTAIRDVTRFDDLIPSLNSYVTAPHGVVLIRTDKDMGEVISNHVRRFFDRGGRFDVEEGIESARAAESTAEQTSAQVAATQPTTFGYNPELEKLLRAEIDDERPEIATLIHTLLVKPDALAVARLLAASWEAEGEREKAAVVRRHILSLQPEGEEAQQALRELQEKEKESALLKAVFGDKQTPPSQTLAQEHASTPAETDEPPELGYSDSLKRIVSMAKLLKRQLDKSNFDRETLLTSLFLYQEESAAFVSFSAFGVRAETLLARLWERERRSYPASLTPDELRRQAEHVFEVESGIQTVEQFVNILWHDDRNAGNDMLEVLEIMRGQKEEFQARHLFWALMLSDPSGWIEATLGAKQTACIKRLLAEKGLGATITRADVSAAIVQDKLFVNPPTHRDSAAKEDLLGFKTHADALVDIIEKDATRPPLVIGVYGPWGAGKSTFMGLVKQKLDERSEERARVRAEREAAKSLKGRLRRAFAHPLRAARMWKKPPPDPESERAPLKVVTIEYDAWAYADTPKLWSGLIGKVAKELDVELGWYGRVAYLFKRHSRRLAAAIVVGLVPVALFALGLIARFLQNFAATNQAGARVSDFLQQIGFSALLGSNTLSKIVTVATPIVSLLYALALQKRPVTDAVTALAARFDSAPAAGIVSRIQDEFKTALETKINPAEKPETEDAKKSKIRQRVEQNQLKIVVFIDELDRCPLERIVDILEAIKLFLAEDIFIVFLGVDTRVAAEAIRLHYKDVKNPDLPREYLEKIVQLPLRVPQADEDEIKEYLGSFMPGVAPAARQTQNGDGARANVYPAKATPKEPSPSGATDALAQEVAGSDTNDNGNVPERADAPLVQATKAGGNLRAINAPPTDINVYTPIYVPDSAPTAAATNAISTLPSLPDTEDEYECIAGIAREFLESNPRRIKRLLNTYRYVKNLASASGEQVGTRKWQEEMLAWLAFTMKWPAFMERAVEAAQAQSEAAKVPGAASSGNGGAPSSTDSGAPSSTDSFLSKLLNDNTAREQQPAREEIEKYLPFDAAAVALHYQLAGNFLIENPRPYTGSHDARPQPTTTAATATDVSPQPSARKNKNAET